MEVSDLDQLNFALMPINYGGDVSLACERNEGRKYK